jgi:DUF971 family protein
MSAASAPWPLELRVRRQAKTLQIDFDDGQSFDLPAALLRAMTPSAAERGHGRATDAPIQRDFSGVALLAAQPVGAYAVRLTFDDGHDSGIYTWPALYGFGANKAKLIAEMRV